MIIISALMMYFMIAFTALAVVAVAVSLGRSVRAFKQGYADSGEYTSQQLY